MLYLGQAVFVVVRVGVHLRHTALPACRMRVGHGLRLSRESIAGGGHLVSVQQVTLHGLGYLSLDVIVISRVQPGRCAEYGDFAAGQVAFSVSRIVSREVAVVKACLAAEVIVVVVVLHPDGLGVLVLSVAFALFGQPVQVVILVVSPTVLGVLVAVLREDHPVGCVIVISGRARTGYGLLRATSIPVILVLEGVFLQIVYCLIFRLEHKAQVIPAVIHVVRIVLGAALQLTDQYGPSQPVGKGIADLSVLVGGLEHYQCVGEIVTGSPAQRSAVGGVAFAGQHVPRRGHVGLVGTPVAVVAAVPGCPRPVLLDGAVQRGNVEKSNP